MLQKRSVRATVCCSGGECWVHSEEVFTVSSIDNDEYLQGSTLTTTDTPHVVHVVHVSSVQYYNQDTRPILNSLI